MQDSHANPEDFDLYALGALDGQEKQAFEAHVPVCPACTQELSAAKRRALQLGLSAPAMAPQPQVKLALMEKVKAERKGAGPQAVQVKPQKKRWGLRFSFGFAIAAAVLAFATFELVRIDWERGKRINELQAQLNEAQTKAKLNSQAMEAMASVTAAPDSAMITLLQQAGGPPGQAHVMYNARMGLAVYSGQLAPAPSNKSYQLWLVPSSGAPVDAGLVESNQENGAVVVRLTPGLVAKAFAVTMEPAGGMPQPTGPKVLVGAASI
jgi:anti-sigma-K factor RskA